MLITTGFSFSGESSPSSQSDLISWSNLLYHNGESFIIKDPNFYIDDKKKNLETELQEVKKILDRGDWESQLICRFPARFFWVHRKISYKKKLSFNHCKELQQFIVKAPAESISLMFASENISIPSSMMGHIYLKVAGINKEKREVEHGISFFTDVAEGNFPRLVFETLISGKKGYYALSPASQLRNNYLYSENRNLWDYELALSDFQRELFHLHLFEMKRIKLRYFFHTFNCATLIYRMLKIMNLNLEEIKRPWITPLDIVRVAHKSKMIKKQSVELSERWKIKALISSHNIDYKTLRLIKKNKLEVPSGSFVFDEVSSAYNGYLFQKGKISKEEHIKRKNHLKSEHFLDLSKYKNPVNTKSTAQFGMGYRVFNQKTHYHLSFLPASHLIGDDSSEYLNESELQIGALDLRWTPDDNEIKIHEFLLYSSVILIPNDYLTGGISSDISLGHKSIVNSNLKERSLLYGSLKFGKNYRIHRDVDLFLLGGSALQDGLEFVPGYLVGSVVRAVFNSKFIFSYGHDYFSKDSYQRLSTSNIQANFSFTDYLIALEYSDYSVDKESRQNYSIGIKKYF